MMTFVEDRFFNDLRYHINSDRLFELGWREQVSWEEGIRTTFDWYVKNTHRYGDIESALVAHPRAGLLLWYGFCHNPGSSRIVAVDLRAPVRCSLRNQRQAPVCQESRSADSTCCTDSAAVRQKSVRTSRA